MGGLRTHCRPVSQVAGSGGFKIYFLGITGDAIVNTQISQSILHSHEAFLKLNFALFSGINEIFK